MMDILLWIVFGLIVGVIAKFALPGRDAGGIVLTIALGIAGAVVGGWLGRLVGLYRPGDADGFIMAVAGAIVILVLYRVVTSGRSQF
jgi:uncharacterized membrane protein YeaQ/YmgE (transglycosylase-associated protein family)